MILNLRMGTGIKEIRKREITKKRDKGGGNEIKMSEQGTYVGLTKKIYRYKFS